MGNALRAVELFEQKDFRKLRLLGDRWPELEGKVKDGIQSLRAWTLNIARDIIQRDIQDLDNHKDEVDQVKHRTKENIIRKLKRIRQGTTETISGMRDEEGDIASDPKGMVKKLEDHWKKVLSGRCG